MLGKANSSFKDLAFFVNFRYFQYFQYCQYSASNYAPPPVLFQIKTILAESIDLTQQKGLFNYDLIRPITKQLAKCSRQSRETLTQERS